MADSEQIFESVPEKVRNMVIKNFEKKNLQDDILNRIIEKRKQIETERLKRVMIEQEAV